MSGDRNRRRKSDFVEMLLKSDDEKPEAKGETSKNSLHQAAGKGRLEIVKFLIDKGAKLDSLDKEGNTSLHIVVKGTNIDMMKVLMEKGAEINAKNNEGATPLHTAVRFTCSNKVLELLLEKGADVEAKTAEGLTPLHEAAVRFTSNNALNILIDHGANINCRDNLERTPLYLAVFEGQVPQVKTLLKLKADVHCTPELVQKLYEKATTTSLVNLTIELFVPHLISMKKSKLLTDEMSELWKPVMTLPTDDFRKFSTKKKRN